jgi:hypothetical protein
MNYGIGKLSFQYFRVFQGIFKFMGGSMLIWQEGCRFPLGGGGGGGGGGVVHWCAATTKGADWAVLYIFRHITITPVL